MTDDEFTRQQYVALCEEIRASKARIFWLLILGMGLVFASGYLAAEHPSAFSNAGIPFLLVGLMLAYITEQNNIARAGRYVREIIEPRHEQVQGWERWLESRQSLREVDHYFVVGFSVLFLIFFAIATSLALQYIDFKYHREWYTWSAAIAYGFCAVLVVYVLWRHWRASKAT